MAFAAPTRCPAPSASAPIAWEVAAYEPLTGVYAATSRAGWASLHLTGVELDFGDVDFGMVEHRCER